MALILRQIGGVISLVLPNSSLAAASGTACAAALQERRQSHATATSGPGAGPLEAARAANAPLADPWTFTSQLIKRKTYQKRCRHLIQVTGLLHSECTARARHASCRIISQQRRFLVTFTQVLEREQVERLTAGKELPAFRSGDILEVTTVRSRSSCCCCCCQRMRPTDPPAPHNGFNCVTILFYSIEWFGVAARLTPGVPLSGLCHRSCLRLAGRPTRTAVCA